MRGFHERVDGKLKSNLDWPNTAVAMDFSDTEAFTGEKAKL